MCETNLEIELNEHMTKSNAEILRENAKAEFEKFKADMLDLPKECIFRSAFEINAKHEIYGYLNDWAEEALDDEELKVLAELGETVIETLYCYFLGGDNFSIMFYSDIDVWVHGFLSRDIKT